MVSVGGGSLEMGATAEQWYEADNAERPAHNVTLRGFSIGESEVTQGLWKVVMGNNPSYFKLGDSYPVEQVSYDDCKAFIRKLNELTGKTFRLPTEAEWEYAARGGRRSRGKVYAGSDNMSNVGWYDANAGGTTHPVKNKGVNELGLYDMSGNVWEWCNDWFGEYGYDDLTNPRGPSSGSTRILRGGSWYNGTWHCRVSFRSGEGPSLRTYIVGFRLAQ
ncbi:MAG: formylglycine-generating enzyme family protein [Bacteroidales bacterium]|nr:formylglycine-generating enzyme family protein [Bacteroidales bacterium]